MLSLEENNNADNDSVLEGKCIGTSVKKWVSGKDLSLFEGRQIRGESESH